MKIANQKQIIKKVHAVGSSMVITIDPLLVKKLNINEMTYCSQEATENGLVMKIKKFSDDSHINNRDQIKIDNE
jgi:hypothetical protein